MEGDGADLEGGESDVQAGPALDAPADGRTARPEPFEHTFGAQAHPAESAASDPTSRDTHRADPTRASEPNTVTLPQTPES